MTSFTRGPAVPVLERDGVRFRDLNKNGRVDPYEDPRLPVEQQPGGPAASARTTAALRRRRGPELLELQRRVPTIVVVHLDRPAVLTELTSQSAALLGEFGASDEAVQHA